jgi:hypothetical protein
MCKVFYFLLSSVNFFWELYLSKTYKSFWWVSYDNSFSNLYKFKVSVHKGLEKYFKALDYYKLDNLEKVNKKSIKNKIKVILLIIIILFLIYR